MRCPIYGGVCKNFLCEHRLTYNNKRKILSTLKDQLIQSLKDQKEIFGDELFEDIGIRKTEVVKKQTVEKLNVQQEEGNSLFEFEEDRWKKAATLEEFEALIQGCQKCELYKGRNNLVFGSGNPNADVMVVGEGPGADEDAQGLPFVGRAGKLLTEILKAINFSRDEVYIANIVKSRPPGNRTPNPSEMEACMPYLIKQDSILCLMMHISREILKLPWSLTPNTKKFLY